LALEKERTIMIEIGFILLVFAIIIGAILIIKSIKNFIINATMGLLILFLANAVLNLGMGYSWLVIIICGIGGVLGAVLVIVLHLLGVVL
jgi:hypothetical protein